MSYLLRWILWNKEVELFESASSTFGDRFSSLIGGLSIPQIKIIIKLQIINLIKM
jgi:hypothetical protein